MIFKPIMPLCYPIIAIVKEDSYNKLSNIKTDTEPQTIIWIDIHVTKYSLLAEYVEQLAKIKEKDKFNLLKDCTRAIAYFLLFYTLNIIGSVLGYSPEIIDILESKHPK